MWHKDKEWLHFVKDIIASDVPSAIFLSTYLEYKEITGNFVASLEIIDVHKNKIIKKEHKVRTALYRRVGMPFIFVVGKN